MDLTDMGDLGRRLAKARAERAGIDEQDCERHTDALLVTPDEEEHVAELDFGNDAYTSAGTVFRRNERRWAREERRSAREYAMPTTIASELGIRPRR